MKIPRFQSTAEIIGISWPLSKSKRRKIIRIIRRITSKMKNIFNRITQDMIKTKVLITIN